MACHYQAMTRPAVLVIAGSDSSGGAGLARDLAVAAEFNVRAVMAITAVTAQTDNKVELVQVLPPKMVRAQIESALGSCEVGAVKIGMLGNAATVAVVAGCLAQLQNVPIVLDPVLASSSGAVLLDGAGRRAMLKKLFPMVTLLTPNMMEASILLSAVDEYLLGFGPQAILLKGGHGGGEWSVDLLLEMGQAPVEFSAPRIPAALRGTGCALSTAIAVGLAKGSTLLESCRVAKDHVWAELKERHEMLQDSASPDPDFRRDDVS
jgi:hydroxymethylpyrimidine/phosphomethylpyrimidine kinase